MIRFVFGPDNDRSGEKYALKAREMVEAIGGRVCGIIDSANLGLPTGGDCVDWFQTHPDATLETILAFTSATTHFRS